MCCDIMVKLRVADPQPTLLYRTTGSTFTADMHAQKNIHPYLLVK
jgi:hypothetical protein